MNVADDPSAPRAWPAAPPTAPPPPVATGPVLGSGSRWTKKQRAAAAVITPDARCTPVLVRAAIVGKARMPRAALEVTTPAGEVLGHLSLVNTSDAFDPQLRWWLVGDPTPGSVVALVSEGGRQVVLPGGRLKRGPAVEQEWSPVACRMLGWRRPALGSDAPAGFHAVFADDRATPDNPEFLAAVKRFRIAAVTIPMVFTGVLFPYLFVIPFALEGGTSPLALLALPVVGGGLMGAHSARCRSELAAEAERVEAGAKRWGKEIAFTQSYWTGMRKPATPWEGPLPHAIV